MCQNHYQSPHPSNWTGRASAVGQARQYWHEAVKLLSLKATSETSANVALLGYACDEGVRRNLGRVGAVGGATALRRRLAKLPWHFGDMMVADIGDVCCHQEAMEDAQDALAYGIHQLLSNDVFPIVMGGGHDVAYGHFKGIAQFLKNKKQQRIGIVNFDAHFDLRPVETTPNSGTPFYQILSEYGQEFSVGYFALGIQRPSNTHQLFNIAQKYGVRYLLSTDCEPTKEGFAKVQDALLAYASDHDYLYITIDLDGFSSAYAPGVSAPSPMGFTPAFALKALRCLFGTGKVLSLDIAELNPLFDLDNHTATLAARLVDEVVSCL